MSDQDNGKPIVNINLPDSWGGQTVEKVEVDSNRLSPAGERRELWTAAIELPARVPDILLQALAIASLAAFTTSLARLIPPRWELLPFVVMIMVMVLVCILVCWNKYPSLRLFLFYWGALIVCGVSMGVLL